MKVDQNFVCTPSPQIRALKMLRGTERRVWRVQTHDSFAYLVTADNIDAVKLFSKYHNSTNVQFETLEI